MIYVIGNTVPRAQPVVQRSEYEQLCDRQANLAAQMARAYTVLGAKCLWRGIAGFARGIAGKE